MLHFIKSLHWKYIEYVWFKSKWAPRTTIFYRVLSTLYLDDLKSIVKAARIKYINSRAQNYDQKVKLPDEIINKINENFNQQVSKQILISKILITLAIIPIL